MSSGFLQFVSFVCCSPLVCSAAFIDDLATPALWEQSVDELFMTMPKGASFIRIDASSMRIPLQPEFKVADFEHGDVILKWNESRKLTQVELMLYSKGVDGELESAEFKKKILDAETFLNEKLAVEGQLRKGDSRVAGVKCRTKAWQTEKCGVWVLDSLHSGKGKQFTSEFIRLTIGTEAGKGGAEDAVSRESLKENVAREADGTVWIKNVPMVESAKGSGYCVPATVARVFAYYGMDSLDQHVIAALCQSGSKGGGTTMTQMRNALQGLSKKYNYALKTAQDCTMEEMVTLYNQEAKKQQVETLSPARGSIADSKLFDADVLRAARTRNAAKAKKWMAEVKKCIDAGEPIIWDVKVGVFEEKNSQQMDGFHTRLIVGYNLQNKTIIYSDSWGAKHIRKELPWKDAYSMSLERNVIRLAH
ncbi:MAG: hypothetical protein IKV82_00870 [Akkermansia sp.]|nr:hypothetical protein [Akkermansia sp.]